VSAVTVFRVLILMVSAGASNSQRATHLIALIWLRSHFFTASKLTSLKVLFER
jgi:hypothetical protein